ncbi:MAG: hypothetical protein ABW215_06470 [Kibdelosporangium sp.]
MRKIEFAELLGSPTAEGEGIRLNGRCYRGPIQIGDIFTVATARGEAFDVALRVGSLFFIGKYVSRIDKGQIGEVWLAGQGLQVAIGGVRLRGIMP